MDGLHLYPDPEPAVDALVGRLRLDVFAHNRAARALYDRLGYVVTEDFWGRRL